MVQKKVSSSRLLLESKAISIFLKVSLRERAPFLLRFAEPSLVTSRAIKEMGPDASSFSKVADLKKLLGYLLSSQFKRTLMPAEKIIFKT